MAKKITITEEVKEAFDFLWGLYTTACEGTDEDWHTEDEKKKLSKLHEKIKGK
jgi:hypothetical protein